MSKRIMTAAATVFLMAGSCSTQAQPVAAGNYDGVYSGTVEIQKIARDECSGGNTATFRVKDNRLVLSANNNHTQQKNTVEVSSTGEISGRIGDGELTGTIKDNVLSAKYLVYTCLFRYTLTKK